MSVAHYIAECHVVAYHDVTYMYLYNVNDIM